MESADPDPGSWSDQDHVLDNTSDTDKQKFRCIFKQKKFSLYIGYEKSIKKILLNIVQIGWIVASVQIKSKTFEIRC